LAVTDWRLRRWRLWLLALMTATMTEEGVEELDDGLFVRHHPVSLNSSTPSSVIGFSDDWESLHKDSVGLKMQTLA